MADKLEPIVRGGKPSRTPLRGPLQLPTEVQSSAHLGQIMKENDLILHVVSDLMSGRCHSANGTVHNDVLGLMERLHRNILYLAILHDTSKMAS